MRPTTPPALALLAAVVWTALAASPAAAVDPGSELITCDHADERVEITVLYSAPPEIGRAHV